MGATAGEQEQFGVSRRKARVRLADSGGLYLEVTPNGSRRWFWKYRFGSKEKRLALGHYTEGRICMAHSSPSS